MSTELERQLTAYCAWLENAHELQLRPIAAAPASEGADGEGVVIPLESIRGAKQRRLAVLGVGLLAIAAMIVGLVLVLRPVADTSRPITTPTIPTATTVAPPVAPVPTVPRVVEGGTLQVLDTWQDTAPVRTVEYRAAVGDAPDELGLESCGPECEALAPWSPIDMPNGTLLIADVFNHRWVSVGSDGASVTPFGPSDPVSQPVVDASGRVYVVFGRFGSSSAVGTLSVYDDSRLDSALASVPIDNATVFSRVELSEDAVLVNGSRVEGTPPPDLPGVPMAELGTGPAPSVDVVWQNTHRRWEFPEGWSAYVLPGGARPDGSVLVWAAPPSAAGYWIRLKPDGRSAAIPAVSTVANNGELHVGDTGIVVLEGVPGGFEVARYDLP